VSRGAHDCAPARQRVSADNSQMSTNEGGDRISVKVMPVQPRMKEDEMSRERQQMSRRKQPEMPAPVPAATARHRVLVPPGGAIPVTPPVISRYTIGGYTANFGVFFENTLGSDGQPLADAILGSCEQDLSQLRSFFGGVSTGRFSVFIDAGSQYGANHVSCASTEIHCLNVAYNAPDGELENFLNCAEVDEVLMAAQAKGWDCGASAGEGLSRVLATELHPEGLTLFRSAHYWLNSARPDWVTQTAETDHDHVSTGCATLFINYLRHQLHFSLAQIVQAGGTTLQQTYEQLTGSTDAFGPFASLLEAAFPPGVTVDLPNDNPFPLSEVPDVMNEPAQLAGKDVLLSGLAPKFTGAGQIVNSQTPIAGKVVPGGSIVTMALVQDKTP
jgi:hypothetical protein